MRSGPINIGPHGFNSFLVNKREDLIRVEVEYGRCGAIEEASKTEGRRLRTNSSISLAPHKMKLPPLPYRPPSPSTSEWRLLSAFPMAQACLHFLWPRARQLGMLEKRKSEPENIQSKKMLAESQHSIDKEGHMND